MWKPLLDQLLASSGMPTLRQPLELILTHVASKTELLSQSPLPLTVNVVALAVIRL